MELRPMGHWDWKELHAEWSPLSNFDWWKDEKRVNDHSEWFSVRPMKNYFRAFLKASVNGSLNIFISQFGVASVKDRMLGQSSARLVLGAFLAPSESSKLSKISEASSNQAQARQKYKWFVLWMNWSIVFMFLVAIKARVSCIVLEKNKEENMKEVCRK